MSSMQPFMTDALTRMGLEEYAFLGIKTYMKKPYPKSDATPKDKIRRSGSASSMLFCCTGVSRQDNYTGKRNKIHPYEK